MPSFSPAALAVPPSGIRRIHELAIGLPDVLMLAVGEPAVPVAPHVLAAGSAAWLGDDTAYTPNGGVLPLREAIAARLRAGGIDAGADRVWVTAGATEALYLALSLVLEPGDEVLVPDPGYTTFTMAPRMLSAVPVRYPLDAAAGFLPDPLRIEAAVTPRTRAILVNSPSNPLGTVLDDARMRALLDVAARHDLWVISDEVYEAFVWRGRHVSPAAIAPDRVLSVFSLSKTYALTGGRVGYLVTPPAVDGGTLRTFQEALISCVNTPAQRAALAAIAGPQDAVVAARHRYRADLDAALALLADRGVRALDPDGAFYLWIDVADRSGGDVAAWAERVLVERRVAVAPGSAFGPSGEGWIRVCAAAGGGPLLAGLDRLFTP